MKNARLILLMLMALLAISLGSCSSGGDGPDTTPPPTPDPGDQGPGGDPNLGSPPRRPVNPFASPFEGGYENLKGIAATREFVYVADANRVYAFDKLGNFRNSVASLDLVQGIAVFPAIAATELNDTQPYFLANCPVISHDPVGGWGYVTVYPPGLDPGATREDVGNPDARRIDAFVVPLTDPPFSPVPFAPTAIFDIKVDRHGSVMCIVDYDVPASPIIPDWPRLMHVWNRYNDYQVVTGGTALVEDDTGEETQQPVNGFHREFGAAVGDFDYYNDTNDITPTDWVNTGRLAVDRLQPSFITSSGYNLYLGSASFLRDYVGITSMDVQLAGIGPAYIIGQSIDNGFGYNRIIGGLPGGGPGSFSPDGVPNLDPDLTQGGPSGMAVDPRNDNIYICDPGNARIQVFNPSGALIEILTGYTAPSSVAIDYDGNVFVCDVNQVRVLYRTLPDAAFGSVGGTVRSSVTGTPLQGSVIQLRDEANVVFEVEISNINGEYRFDNLPIGNYHLTASKFNYVSDFTPQSVQVRQDMTVVVNFNLDPITGVTVGQYSGTVADSFTNLPIPNVDIQIVGTALTGRTDVTGRFTIDNIPSGTYQVLFTRNNYETVTKDITILRGQTTEDNNIVMTPTL